MLLQQKRQKGLDLRSNNMNRPDDRATILENLDPDSSGDWVKRRGFKLNTTEANIIDTEEYEKGGQKIHLKAASLHKSTGGAASAINFGGNLPTNSWTELASWAEYNGVLYWTDPAGDIDLFKYDGYMAYKAGIPKMSATSGSAAGGVYYRLAYYFIDLQGNITWGDYQQFGPLIANAIFDINTLNNTEYWGRHGKSSASLQVINSGNLTVNVVAGHNYVAGDYVRMEMTIPQFFVKPVKIDSVTATTITFNSADIGTNTKNYALNEVIEQRMFTAIFASTNETFGYVKVDESPLSFPIVMNADNVVVVPNIVADTIASTDIPMEDVYDTTILKGLPPRFKYIWVYNNVLVGANLSNNNFITGNPLTSTTNNQRDTIYWSDPGVGSTVETFGPNDFEVIGRTDEGGITGLFAASDSMVILKEKQVYYLNGILTGRFFRVRSALTNGIGAIGNRSVVEMQGGCIFLSSRGIYWAKNGGNPMELSDIIEPLFTGDTTGLNLSKAIGAVSHIDEKIYMFIPSDTSDDNDVVVCYDYYWKDWFLYKNIKGEAGFLIDKDNLMYHVDSSGNIYERQDTKSDNSAAITGRMGSSWFNLNLPSLRKKFVNFILLSQGSTEWEATVRSQVDWDDSEDKNNSTISVSDSIHIYDSRLANGKHTSLRIIIENDILNEDMLITGYEVEYEKGQTKPKGEE